MAPSATDILPEASSASNKDLTLSKQTSHYVDLWSKHIRGGFATFPVAVESAQDHIITDVDGKKYIDFISQFAVMNFGYSHPKIVKAAAEQIQKMPLKFGYDSIATMLSGSEAVESAVKIARKWAYTKKGISEGEAWILTTDQCYHGLTLATMPLATVVAKNFGQHVPNVGPYAPTSGKLIQYGDVEVLEETFKQDGHKIAAFLVEAVQGWAGTRFPPKGYLKAVQELCNKYNILFICDEIQSGYGRTGKDLAYQHEEGVHPDLVTLGKAVTGGFYPMSVIMGKKDVMDVLGKNEVLSTFGAAPVACAAAIASLEVLEEEKISERSQRLGELLAKTVKKLSPPHVKELRGGALFQSLVLDESVPGVTARRVAALAALRGVLVGIGAGRLRFSPPITITEEDLVKAIEIVVQALKDVTTLGNFPGSDFIN
ncbi:hypothetical protein NW754_001114 [Fusarium falciforme]|nr:hypothetical protein NW754_001114 [Fusarium falciforme]KAJ4253239.1 hypothetical protein NW757_005947 [Fusarium falciforme]